MEKIKDATHSKTETFETHEVETEPTEASRNWLRILKTALGEFRVIPTVHSAAVEKPPEKPEPIPPQKLPIYESPHSKYKEYAKAKEFECAKVSPFIRDALQPIVRSTRIGVQDSYNGSKKALEDGLCSAGQTMDAAADRCVSYLRKEENLTLRQGLVGIGGAAGCIFSLRNGVTLKIINTTIGATAMGALCFPKETDQLVRKTAIFGKDTFCDIYFFVYGERFCKEERKCPEVEREDRKD